MKAFVITGPRECAVTDVDSPTAGPGQVVIDVERVGLCGTDVEFYTGEMAYLRQGAARYPIRIGHEWCGAVSAVGPDVDPSWIGRRTVGDTMLGCGVCARCRSGRQHVCADRFEVGIRGGWPGALARQMPMPVSALRALPDSVDAVAGAMVEPGANALRAFRAAELTVGQRLLVLGPGTIGLLVALFALAAGVEVHLLGPDEESLTVGRSHGVRDAWTVRTLPALTYDAVVDCANDPALPAFALDAVEPGGRVVYIGIAGEPSRIDTRTLVFKDVTAVGVLSGSPGLPGAIEAYASGAVNPRPLVAATVGLTEVGDVLAGWRPEGAGPGPKIHVDPRN